MPERFDANAVTPSMSSLRLIAKVSPLKRNGRHIECATCEIHIAGASNRKTASCAKAGSTRNIDRARATKRRIARHGGRVVGKCHVSGSAQRHVAGNVHRAAAQRVVLARAVGEIDLARGHRADDIGRGRARCGECYFVAVVEMIIRVATPIVNCYAVVPRIRIRSANPCQIRGGPGDDEINLIWRRELSANDCLGDAVLRSASDSSHHPLMSPCSS